MNKRTLQKIISLASFVFEEKEYNRFINLIKQDEYTSARLLIDDLLEEFELKIHLEEHDEVTLSQCKMVKELDNIVMGLIEEENEGEEQITELIRKHVTP